MLEAIRERAKAVVLLGATAPALAEALADAELPVERAPTLEEAVERAFGLARPGEVVLLAPGHASWDMFENYERRGEAFRAAAEGLGLVPVEDAS
jgi:UDP-N-acetylmuramoylalanine--D-glutamate ligase